MSVRRRDSGAPTDLEAVDLPETWRRRPWIPYLIMAAVLVAALGSGYAIQQVVATPQPAELLRCATSTATGPYAYLGPQPRCILPHHKYTVTVNTTQGKMVIELLPDQAPETVNNFVVLAVNGFYNHLTWWKSEDWVIQTGDPNNNGTGGPGYNLNEEPNANIPWGLGAVGMARVPGGPVNGSQFFIMKANWPGSGPTAVYNRFGTVVSGMDKGQLITTQDSIQSITVAVT
jgi:cyclophilin family peptidyl-prolyl cis-trans isomerase